MSKNIKMEIMEIPVPESAESEIKALYALVYIISQRLPPVSWNRTVDYLYSRFKDGGGYREDI